MDCNSQDASGSQLRYECCLDLGNADPGCFHRLSQLALDGLTLIAQGWAPAPDHLSTAKQPNLPERRPAGIWALTPGIDMYNRLYLMLAEVLSVSEYH